MVCLCPDSFSDGGQFTDVERAVAHGVEMAQQGAAIIDIGAESTRPGSAPVSADQQIARAIPVIRKLSRQIDIPISIDTTSPAVAQAALEAGAGIINDITALTDEAMMRLAVMDRVLPGKSRCRQEWEQGCLPCKVTLRGQ